MNRFNKEGKKYTIQRPYETAQQKAAKRANKLLDSKRQQEVEKIAAEKLGNHEKKCPICEHPFKDVNEFMAHLSKCNVLESSEDEEAPMKGDNEDQNSTKPADRQEDGLANEHLPKSTGNILSSDNTKLKVHINQFIWYGLT